MCEERCIHPVKDIGLYTVLGRNEATINMLFSCSVTSDSCDPWTVDRQAPLSTGFPSKEYWNGFPFPSPGDILDPGIELVSPALAGRLFTPSHLGSPRDTFNSVNK